MHIPIENIYYLLCYAWNKLEEKERINISLEESTELIDLFAKVLINSTKHLLKRGLHHNYVENTDEVLGIKGKLLLGESIKTGNLQKQKTICSFDTFSPNILTNQILVTTIYHLIKTKGLNKELRKELTTIIRMLPPISQIKITDSIFKTVRLNRNNVFYKFILNVCQIIHENLLPTERNGEYTFMDFSRDENKMNKLFESFVYNFYNIEQNRYKVRREIIHWNFEKVGNHNENYLPQMETDITLESYQSKIIIDTKFYKKTLIERYDRKRIHSANLYQIFSYLLNQKSESPKTQTASGILLYPTIEEEYNLHYRYGKHNIKICTVNLNTNWMNISKRLKEIIEV